MANDPPSNQRMGFGFMQAKSAGAPYVAPPGTNQMNYDIKEAAAQKALRTIREGHPHLSDRIKEFVQIKCDGSTLSAQDILFLIKCEIASKSKIGFTVINVNDVRYPSDKIKQIFLDGVHILYNGKTEIFHRSAVKDIVVGKMASAT